MHLIIYWVLMQTNKIFKGSNILSRVIKAPLKLLTRQSRGKVSSGLPSLHYMQTPRNEEIVNSMECLQRPYKPTPWIAGAHAQSIAGALLRTRPPILYRREVLTLPDGGQLAVDWDTGKMRKGKSHVIDDADDNDNEEAKAQESATSNNVKFHTNTPILLLLPGLSGTSQTKYIRQLVLQSRSEGIRSVVFNYRGFAGVEFTTPKPSTGVDVSDIAYVVDHVHRKFPHAPIIPVGFSMGANMLVKYLGLRGKKEGENNDESSDWTEDRTWSHELNSVPISGAVAVSNAFDFVKLSNSLENNPINQAMYSRFLTYMVKKHIFSLEKNKNILSQVPGVDIDQVQAATTIYELDELMTRRLYGIPTVEEYYDKQSSRYYVEHVDTPLFCLNALDDPFAGEIPYQALKKNSDIILTTTQQGGHVCWSTGANPFTPRNSWMISVILQYAKAVLKAHDL